MGLHAEADGTLPPDLASAVAVVIGASGGIGAAVAVGLGRCGAEVVLGGRSRDGMARTAEQVTAVGGRAHVETVDVRNTEEIARFAATVADGYGTPRVLVNSMGGALYKPALDVTVEEWDDLHSTHLRGAFFACQAFAPGMRDAGYGKIVNMSSTWAFTVAHGRSVYASAKAGLGHLTSALALEWAPFGIRVNAVAPTTVRTPRVEERLIAEPEAEQYAVSRIPLGRLGTTDDVVGPVLFLAGRSSDFVTGHTLLVDGGWVTAK
jgi:NAD(P)-dependent dehydrogenase (short-subunit alcohol dehydrogenase family)